MNRSLAFCRIVLLSSLFVYGESPSVATPPEKGYVAVFDFVTYDRFKKIKSSTDKPSYGVQLADAVRRKLRRNASSEINLVVLDKNTMNAVPEEIHLLSDFSRVQKIMTEKLGAHVGLYGTVKYVGRKVQARIICLDLRKGTEPIWAKEFMAQGQRARAELARQIVEMILGKSIQKPVEYGDDPEPTREQLGRPLNVNGTFDAGAKGWDAPDNVSTFLLQGPKGRGTILRVRTDLQRDDWLTYRKALRAGKADPKHPPAIAKDTGYGSVAGLEGVHYRSKWINATPGKRYWLLADCKHNTPGKEATPKVFVKGFQKTPHALDGLPESALVEMNLTPKQFAALPAPTRKELIAADAKKHPMRYVRECYRWYLHCKSAPGKWNHFAAPFPPRGGLPGDVEFLQIQIYSYWPPGEYFWDNVLLFEAPWQDKK